MTDEREVAMRRSLMALRLEVPKEIADDVERRVLAYVDELRAQNARLTAALRRIANEVSIWRAKGIALGAIENGQAEP